MYIFLVMQALVWFFFFTALTESAIPPNFKKCYRNDPNFRKCFSEAAQHAVPQLTKAYKSLDIPNMDPMEVSSLQVLGTGGAVRVDQNFNNCQFYGMTKSKIHKLDLDLEKKTLDIDVFMTALDVQCDYQIDGKVLLLPIKGEGNSSVIFRNYRVKFRADFEEIVKRGKTHYKTIQSVMETEPEVVSVQFDNLFNGNKELSDNMNNVLNDNWKEIYTEVKPDYDELTRQLFVKLLDRFWNKVSLEELFD